MLNPDYKGMLERLSEEGVSFLLVGAYALAVYGHPHAPPRISTSSYGRTPSTRRILVGVESDNRDSAAVIRECDETLPSVRRAPDIANVQPTFELDIETFTRCLDKLLELLHIDRQHLVQGVSFPRIFGETRR